MKKTLVLAVSGVLMLTGCAATKNKSKTGNDGEWTTVARTSDQTKFEEFQRQFERMVAYSQIIGNKLNSERILGISRYGIHVEKKTAEGYQVLYSAKCPVGYELDSRGIVIKPYFAKTIEEGGIVDCNNLLADYSQYVQTGKTIAQRKKEEQAEYLQEARKHKGTPEYMLWVKKAADIGNVDAQYEVGLDYLTGKYFQKDNQKGIEYMTLAATNGNASAQGIIGHFYLNLKRSASDLAWAYAMLKAASIQNPQSKSVAEFQNLAKQLNAIEGGKSVIAEGEKLLKTIKTK